MINFIKRLLGIKPKPINYVWLNIVTNDRGVIGWSASNRQTAVRGRDTFQK